MYVYDSNSNGRTHSRNSSHSERSHQQPMYNLPTTNVIVPSFTCALKLVETLVLVHSITLSKGVCELVGEYFIPK